MKISVIGTGYVGLVTGATLADIGHEVMCVDVDVQKVEQMKQAISPIYEPGLGDLMARNIAAKRLNFTSDPQSGFKEAEVIYIAVGTPENEDGSANLTYIEQAAKDIADHIENDIVIVVKSTVPVGTNHKIKQLVEAAVKGRARIAVVSNPEFLKEGSAIQDTFYGDRIVIGSDDEPSARIVEAINEPFGVPVFHTDTRSAEMIKYASNAFLATKISFINEISNICELVGANVENVAAGMGMDSRIGHQFLKAGIGYGGSCFPKDTEALIQIAGNVNYEFELLKGVVNVNRKQQLLLIEKLNACVDSLAGKRVAVLGLAFKPKTDDMRQAASLLIIEELLKQGAEVVTFDPVATEKAKALLNPSIVYANSLEAAVEGSDAALIVTEWDEIKNADLNVFAGMKRPLVIDGRNCFGLEMVKSHAIEYHSIGRPAIFNATNKDFSGVKWSPEAERLVHWGLNTN
ncbi:UDP-glucose dehydrogenase family protein [Planococcus citreus]|uniref:UDP-glucose 6-dehydrogenase n=1 Tax=Planococcus citreus TaxID=1373 RepID=A0A497YHY9_9BACL|nr:UDP-glucose/GDP-mannose dehydrogenase family protein [Planococcus citreus]RLJ90586.1 UDPglucose 6-dehydrogenase [Planococcus citreus]